MSKTKMLTCWKFHDKNQINMEFENGKLKWLWTMVNKNVCFFLVHPKRSQKAFEAFLSVG